MAGAFPDLSGGSDRFNVDAFSESVVMLESFRWCLVSASGDSGAFVLVTCHGLLWIQKVVHPIPAKNTICSIACIMIFPFVILDSEDE